MLNLEEVKKICTNEFLIPFEGNGPMTADKQYFLAYRDPGSKDGLPITIAWGLTFDLEGKPFKLGDKLAYVDAVKTKQKVLDGFLQKLLGMSPGLTSEPPRRVAAVLSWVYNLGLGNYATSTFRRKVDAKQWVDAAEQCLRWDKAAGKIMKGLTKRRKAEAEVLLKP